MINKELLRAWVAALRSGKFKQVTRSLALKKKGRIGYCCLGVACVVAGIKRKRDGIGEYVFDGDGGVLPKSAQKAFGIGSRNPTIRGKNLSTWNDQWGKNFAEIADMIEKHYKL